MKCHFLFVLMLLCFSLRSQQKNIVVKGTVRSEKDSAAVMNAVIVLTGDDGSLLRDTTGADGIYFLEVKDPKFKKAEIRCETNKKTHTKNHKDFFSCDDKGRFTLPDSLTSSQIYIKDFNLTESIIDYDFPILLFQKNSTDYFWNKSTPEDSARTEPKTYFDWLTKTLIENPELVVQVSCHASSDEQEPDTLASQRALKVYDELIRGKINPKRIVLKTYGIRKLKYSDAVIKKAKTKKEKEILRSKNRRCVVSVISWDFEETKK